MATLAVYLTANVCVRGMHHHAEHRPVPSAFCGAAPCLAASASARNSEDLDCQICSVLFLAHGLPTAGQVVTAAGRTCEAVASAVVSFPHAIESASHSRAPSFPLKATDRAPWLYARLSLVRREAFLPTRHPQARPAHAKQ